MTHEGASEFWLEKSSGIEVFHLDDQNQDGQIDLTGKGFDANNDVLDLSEVLDIGSQDSLDAYLNDHAALEHQDTDGDGQNDATAMTIDQNGDGTADVTVVIDSVVDQLSIQVDDENVDFTDK